MTVAEHLQVGHFMLDNASNNNTAMQKFTGLLKSHGITSDFDANDCRIMCLPHILNICSKHVVEKYMSADFLSVPSGAWVDLHGAAINKSLYVNAVKKDPIKHGRDIVRAVRASSLHCQAYQTTIIHSNAMKVWFDEEGERTELPLLELLRDVKSCWDSIYFMINCLRVTQQVRALIIINKTCSLTIRCLQGP